MATGDQNDFAGRLRAVLPAGWFPTVTPILTGVLTGIGNAFAAIWNEIQYTILQTRIATATGPWLDGISQDYYGGMLPRLAQEQDAAFSARIRANFFLIAATRAGLTASVFALTGRNPRIFEPANTQDTGGYYNLATKQGGGIGYGVAGGYGDLLLPYQFFVTVYQPISGGIANVNGYGGYLGGYGVGAIEYTNPSMDVGLVTPAEMQAAVEKCVPSGYVAWMNISS